MKWTILLLSLLVLVAEAAISQSISPTEAAEYCPLTNITFTVTLPITKSGTTPTVASWTNGPIVVSGVANLVRNTQTQTTTFTFVGRFRDVNIKQEFRVAYETDADPNASRIFSFKNVKSLFYDNTASLTTCLPIQPNTTLITAPRCQVSSFGINFPNVKWSTYGESPVYCFGTITTYEYQLPSGWSIGAAVSNGSN